MIWSIAPGTEDALIPILLLQPLAENAIRHGIAPKAEGGVLRISVDRDGRRVRCRISDDGVGRHTVANGERRGRHGIGLANTIKRLRVLYGEDHYLAVKWPENGGCSVEIDLPFVSQEASELVHARLNRG